MLSLIVSTVAFFVLVYCARRWADANDIPRGMTRNVAVFTFALALAYAIAWAVDQVWA
ncbi:MAG: hypothetical protein ACREVD_06865 [Burkholderiales bacterium]